MAMLTNFGHGRVAPDHGHDSFVEVAERLFRLSSYRSRNIFCTPLSRLFGHGCKLWQRLPVRASDVGKISERVDAREILHAKIGLHINTSTMASSYPDMVRQHGRFQASRPNHRASQDFSSVREQHMVGSYLLDGGSQPDLHAPLL